MCSGASLQRARGEHENWLDRDLDLYADDRSAEVERLITLGATRYPWRYRPGADFVVLEDPDGNLFCVVQLRGAGAASPAPPGKGATSPRF